MSDFSSAHRSPGSENRPAHTNRVPDWVYTPTTPLASALAGTGQDHIGPATTVWPTGQESEWAQRQDHYRDYTLAHPRRTRPALATTAIKHFSQPGQTVFDPFAGSGTVLVEAIKAGRRAVGVELDPLWVGLAADNIAFAQYWGATGKAWITRRDARYLDPIPWRLHRGIDLIVTEPPVRLRPVIPGNRCANADLVEYLETDLAMCLSSCSGLLNAGATVVLVVRLLRRSGQTVDLTVPANRAARLSGLDFVERVAALRTPLRDASRSRRPSRMKRRGSGLPRVVHDDVLVYRVPADTPRRWWQR
jgi:16S rRNA G966 N2-methylase RsmD